MSMSAMQTTVRFKRNGLGSVRWLDMWFLCRRYQPMTSKNGLVVQMNQSNCLGAVALMLPLQTLFKAQGHGRVGMPV